MSKPTKVPSREHAAALIRYHLQNADIDPDDRGELAAFADRLDTPSRWWPIRSRYERERARAGDPVTRYDLRVARRRTVLSEGDTAMCAELLDGFTPDGRRQVLACPLCDFTVTAGFASVLVPDHAARAAKRLVTKLRKHLESHDVVDWLLELGRRNG